MWNTAETALDLGGWRLINSFVETLAANPKLRVVFIAYICIIIILIIVFMIMRKFEIHITFRLGRKDTMHPLSPRVAGILSFLYFVLSLGVIAIVINHIYPVYSGQSDIMSVRQALQNERVIVHALGTIQDDNGTDRIYTNSVEALYNCYEKGNRIAEIDFTMSDDGALVCSHEFMGFKNREGETGHTESAFLNGTIYDTFTPLAFDALVEFMKEHEDFYVVTDIKSGDTSGEEFIAERCPDLLDRFIIQTYHADEYETVKAMGFDYMIWTLYRTSDERDIDIIRQGILDHDYVAITFWEYWMDGLDKYDGEYFEAEWMNGEEFYDTLLALKVPLCVHTVDDTEDISRDINKGVSAVYTNNVDNDWIRK